MISLTVFSEIDQYTTINIYRQDGKFQLIKTLPVNVSLLENTIQASGENPDILFSGLLNRPR